MSGILPAASLGSSIRATSLRVLKSTTTNPLKVPIWTKSERVEPSGAFDIAIGRGDWRTRSKTWTLLRADKTNFHVEARLEAFEGDAQVVAREWKESVPRDFN